MLHNDDLFQDEPTAFSIDPPLPRKHPFAQCERCPLYARPFVPSSSPDDETMIRLVVVGEAPGFNEAAQGKPFVGVSGQLLDATLERVGIDPKQVFKTNTVLCHPLDNAQPPHDATVACQERLRWELALLPDVPIITAGAAATTTLDNLTGIAALNEPISKRRGNSYPIVLAQSELNYDENNPMGATYVRRKYYPVFHPAFILRQPNSYEVFRADLARIVNPHAFKDWLSIEAIEITEDTYSAWFDSFDLLPDHTLLAVDTETNGLRWFDTPTQPKADLINIVFAYTDKQAFIVPCDLLTSIPQMRADLNALFRRCDVVAHNGMFDWQILYNEGITLPLDHDTMLASYALNELRGYHRLKYLATQFLGVPDYEREILGSAFLDLPSEDRDYSQVPRDALYRYAAIDACVTLALHRDFIPRMIADDVIRAYTNVLIPGAETVVRCERNGIKIDRPYLERLQQFIITELDRLTLDMWNSIDHDMLFIPPPHYKTTQQILPPNTQPNSKNIKAFNPNSVTQVSWLLYEFFGLKHLIPLGYKTKDTSTNIEALLALPSHPFVNALKAHRKAATMLKMYVNKLLSIADCNDRVHVRFNLNGTEVGRLSADDSLHGIPRATDFYGKAIRGSFIADEGNVLIIADYSQAELRVIAANSQEPFFLQAFNATNEERHTIACERYPQLYTDYSQDKRNLLAKLATDLHCQTALFLFPDYAYYELANIERGTFGEGKAKTFRTYAKNFNFGTVYQGGPDGIWSMTGGALPLALVRQLQAQHKARTPMLTQYCKDQFRLAKTQGYVQTRFGRKRRFPLLTQENINEVRKAAVHMPTASEASDLTLLSGYELGVKRALLLCHMVHDSLIFECKREQAQSIAPVIEAVMIATGTKYIPEVRWEVDIEIATRWYMDRPILEDHDHVNST